MDAEIIIIGGGVIGCATAWALTRDIAGRDILIIERGEIGREASWAGGGILSPLLPWDYSEAVTRLTLSAMHAYPGWVDSLKACGGVDPEYRRTGMLVFPPCDPAQARAWATAHGMTVELGGSDQGATAQPVLWLPDVAQVRNPRLMQALSKALRGKGVGIREHTEMLGFLRNGDRVEGISTSQGILRARHVIVAGGAWSAGVLKAYGPALDIRPVRGQMLLFKLAPDVLPHILYRDGLYLIPRSDGHLLVGSTLEDAGFDKTTTQAAARALHEAATALAPILAEVTPIAHWAGLRPGSPGNVPTIARHPEIANLYVNGGHFRYGVTMAPMAARLMRNLLIEAAQPFDMAPYRWPSW
ncbi:MAG: glycine oxidase ThiO [Betaproteobacteria bacterium]|nr:glycine oxidase ThiO [Betaproteobacteria bacterium]